MRKTVMIFLLVLAICVFSLSLFGCAEVKAGENADSANVTVLAKVEDLGDGKIYIRGLTEGFTGNYVFGIEGVMFCREGEEHIAAELQIGDVISVTFTGNITKCIPGKLTGVTKVVRMNG